MKYIIKSKYSSDKNEIYNFICELIFRNRTSTSKVTHVNVINTLNQ